MIGLEMGGMVERQDMGWILLSHRLDLILIAELMELW
jgi:hypothetical protein